MDHKNYIKYKIKSSRNQKIIACYFKWCIFYSLFILQEQALESSRTAREKEWGCFINDIQDKYEKIDDAYQQKEQSLRERYENLESGLVIEGNNSSWNT